MPRQIDIAPDVMALIFRIQADLTIEFPHAPAPKRNDILRQALQQFSAQKYVPEDPPWLKRQKAKLAARKEAESKSVAVADQDTL